jgi:hypothetical protein
VGFATEWLGSGEESNAIAVGIERCRTGPNIEARQGGALALNIHQRMSYTRAPYRRLTAPHVAPPHEGKPNLVRSARSAPELKWSWLPFARPVRDRPATHRLKVKEPFATRHHRDQRGHCGSTEP